MKPGNLVRTTYKDAIRLHKLNPYEQHGSRMDYAGTFLFHPSEVGIILEERIVDIDRQDEHRDLLIWKILTPAGVGYISTGWGTIPRYLRVIT